MPRTLDQRCKELLAISDKVFERKRTRNVLNQETAELFHPMRADFTQDLNYDDFATTVIDGTSVLARQTLGDGIESMLRQGDWFSVSTGEEARDKAPDNARALKFATKRLMGIIKDPRVQFMQSTKAADMDWVTFGEMPLSVEMSVSMQHLVVKSHHPRDNAYMVNADGVIDTNFHDFKMTAREMAQKVASGNWKGPLHETVTRAAEKEPLKEFKIRHILMPADEVYPDDPKRLRDLRHRFISIYIDVDNQTYLNERGSAVFNYVWPRWSRINGHGYSPVATNALGGTRSLQAMALTIMETGERAADPPIVGSAEIFSRDFNNVAGGLTMIDLPEGMKLGDMMTQLETSPQGLSMGIELLRDMRAHIAEAWLLNKLFLPTLRDMRELEVMVRTEEFRRSALPFYQPIENEYHSPLLGTIFEMAMLMRMIPAEAFPEELLEDDVKFTFQSPLKEADGLKIVGAYRQSVALITEGSTVDPTIANMFDFRKATKDAVMGAGADPDWILSDAKAKQKDQEAERVKRLQEAVAIAQGGAGAVSDVSNAAISAQNAGLLQPPQAA